MHRRRTATVLAVVSGLVVALGLLTPPTATAADPHQRGGGSNWVAVSAGVFHTCGIKRDTRIYCWGYNADGELGDGTTTDRHVPTAVDTTLTGWTSVSTGGYSTCARRTGGRLYCWGANGYGQLGDHTTVSRTVPTQVYGAHTYWSSVAMGNSSTCARTTSKRLYCWGNNGFGQLGNNSTSNSSTPVQVYGSSTSWSSYALASYHACARKTSGRLYCWGFNFAGQLGDNTTTQRNRPTQVYGASTSWTTVGAGGNFTCGRKTNGRLYCWGDNAYGQLGNGETSPQSRPTGIASSATNWSSVTPGGSFACARKTTGAVSCWGENAAGEVGNDTQGSPQLTPVSLAGHATDWARLDAGSYHSCATTTSGRLYCWGYNYYGQVGDNTTTNQIAPTEVYVP